MTNLSRLLAASKTFPLAFALSCSCMVFFAVSSAAQTVTPEDLEFFERLQRQTNTGAQVITSPIDRSRNGGDQPSPTTQSNNSTAAKSNKEAVQAPNRTVSRLSRIETDYARRLGRDYVDPPSSVNDTDTIDGDDTSYGKAAFSKPPVVLRQFGYDLFEQPADQSMGVTGRLSDSYVLGVGDELVITLHGATQATYVTQVDREGRVAIPDLGPLPASGHTFGQFKANIEKRTNTALIGTEVNVSVGSLRLITVYVLGEAKRPGVYHVTSLSSAIDAISYAGGVKKSGSLRRIFIRRNGSQIPLDLYGVLQGQADEDYNLYEGDRIVIPVIGDTTAVAGEIIRPAIYELNKNETAADIVEYAGGALRPFGFFVGLKRFENTGKQSYKVLSQPDLKIPMQLGDILTVQYSEDIIMGSVRIEGHVRVPGERPLSEHQTLATLASDVSQFKDEPYMAFAVLETTDKASSGRRYSGVNLRHIMDGKLDYELSDRDRLIVLGVDDIAFLSSPEVRHAVSGEEMESELCSGLLRVARTVADSGAERFTGAVRWAVAGKPEETETPPENNSQTQGQMGQGQLAFAPQPILEPEPVETTENRCTGIFHDHEYLLSFVLENVTAVTGDVRKPGVYPVTRDTSLDLVLGAAGGLTNNADRTGVEITSFHHSTSTGLGATERNIINLYSTEAAMVGIEPRSSIRVPVIPDEQEAGVISLRGEFARPGPYTLKRGERLSSVLQRAGGLTDQAYAYGAVFTRPSVKEEQTAGLRRSVRDLRTALAGAALKPSARQNMQAALQLADSMEGVELPGRVVIESDPAVLAARPELDILVSPGDELFIPKRPNFVSIAGDVLNPGTVPFIGGKRAKDYITDAGGLHETAAKGRVFVVLPNGLARPTSAGGWLGTKKVQIPPGSTVVVPIDGSPFDWLQMTRDMTQILGQLSLTAASIAVIADR